MTKREEYTNKRLANRYDNVRRDYGIIGSGVASYDDTTDTMTISYVEDGVSSEYNVAGIRDESIDYAFNVRTELA